MKKWDWVVIGIVALFSLLPLLMLPRGGEDARVTVAVDGEVVYTGRLDNDAVVEAGAGNTVTVANGRVTMTRADCPDKLCMRGHASAARPLVCLPNSVSVTVTDGEEALDGVSY